MRKIALIKGQNRIFVFCDETGAIYSKKTNNAFLKGFKATLQKNLKEKGLVSLVMTSIFFNQFEISIVDYKDIKWIENKIVGKPPCTVYAIKGSSGQTHGLETFNNDFVRDLFLKGFKINNSNL